MRHPNGRDNAPIDIANDLYKINKMLWFIILTWLSPNHIEAILLLPLSINGYAIAQRLWGIITIQNLSELYRTKYLSQAQINVIIAVTLNYQKNKSYILIIKL